MFEAAKAAESDGVYLSNCDVSKMFDLIYTFDSIKASMLVDKEKAGL
jgi:2-dehydropantoate 2-reductase